MRKAYKKKRRACGLCKPNKRGMEKRWKAKEDAKLRSAEKQITRRDE